MAITHQYLKSGQKPISTSAGTVKMTPEAIEVPADAPVCTMLFSRMPPPPSARSTAIETTAAGIAEAIVMPAHRPRYVLAAARITASTTARMMARAVSCGAVVSFVFMLISRLSSSRRSDPCSARQASLPAA